MALCPFATHRLLPESATQPTIIARAVILHSAAGKGSLYQFFLNKSKLESHFWVGEDGTIEQYIDTTIRADANLKANGFAVSIETESTVDATEPWNPVQYAAIGRLVQWICIEHHIPPRKIPTWDGSGIGYHIQFGAPGPWTPVAKSCPGPARVKQMPGLIDDVAQSEPTDPEELTVADIEAIMNAIGGLKSELAAQSKDIDAIKATLSKDGEVRDAVVSIKRHTVTGDGAAKDDPKVPARILSSLARIEAKP